MRLPLSFSMISTLPFCHTPTQLRRVKRKHAGGVACGRGRAGWGPSQRLPTMHDEPQQGLPSWQAVGHGQQAAAGAAAGAKSLMVACPAIRADPDLKHVPRSMPAATEGRGSANQAPGRSGRPRLAAAAVGQAERAGGAPAIGPEQIAQLPLLEAASGRGRRSLGATACQRRDGARRGRNCLADLTDGLALARRSHPGRLSSPLGESATECLGSLLPSGLAVIRSE